MRKAFTHHELSKIIQMGVDGWQLDSVFCSNGYNFVKMSKGNSLALFEQTEQGMVVYDKVGRIT